VAILDTGVDPSVPQLAGRVLPGVDARTGAPIADDPDGHGTQAAGVVAANGAGVRGVSPATSILPVRIFDPATRSSTADGLANGIAEAVKHGARVIVVEGAGALEGIAAADELKIVKAVGDAWSEGALVIAPAGDDNLGTATMPGSLPHVLSVGASTPLNLKSAQSNTGPWIDLVAPGEGITSPLPGSICNLGFGFSTGTTMAAPAVGGAAALIMGQRPGLTTQQYFELVRRATTDVGSTGRENDTGFGVLNVAAGLSATPQTKETQPEVDDDLHWLRGPYAKAHPPLLTKTKLRFKAFGSVSPAKDPADVYPVQLSKGERLVVSLRAADTAALLELAVLRPAAEDFDITNSVVDSNRAVATGGFSYDPQLEFTATRTGTHYIAIESADAFDPEDPTAIPSDIEPYQLSAYKQKKKKAKKAKKAKSRRSAQKR
jgi:subtilisin family serine protease